MLQRFLLSDVELGHLICNPVGYDLGFVDLPRQVALGCIIDSVAKHGHGLQFLLQYSILLDCNHFISCLCKVFDVSRWSIGHIAGVRSDLLHLAGSPRVLHLELRIPGRYIEALLMLGLGIVTVQLLEHLLSLLGTLSSDLLCPHKVKSGNIREHVFVPLDEAGVVATSLSCFFVYCLEKLCLMSCLLADSRRDMPVLILLYVLLPLLVVSSCYFGFHFELVDVLVVLPRF